MVTIVDYGVGNLFSLRCSLEYIGASCVVTGDEKALASADRIILPGVGAFGDAAEKLRKNNLDKVLVALANRGKPLLGICLGMQLLFKQGHEYGTHKGLGLLQGDVVSLLPYLKDDTCRVPQIGWNGLDFENAACPLLEDVQSGDAVYYVHSYFVPRGTVTAAWSGYGKAEVSGVVWQNNVYGTQFHPEKSGEVGLKILKAFCGIH